MADAWEIQRKRLRYRCWHRGTREMDLLLGTFADVHVPDMSGVQLDRLEALLEIADPDLYAWITRAEAVPPPYDHDVMKLLQHYKITPQAIEKTR